MRLVGTAVLRGCRRAPRPRHGRRLRVDLIVHSGLVDRPGPDGRRRGRKVVCEGSGGPPYTKCVESRANHSWNYPPPSRERGTTSARRRSLMPAPAHPLHT